MGLDVKSDEFTFAQKEKGVAYILHFCKKANRTYIDVGIQLTLHLQATTAK